MDPIGWKRELSQLLDKVEEQATESFTKINERFIAMNLPFDDEFQQNVIKMANIRLESSFAKIAMSQWSARPTHDASRTSNRGGTTKDSNASTQMKIFVEIPSGKTVTLDVEPSETIERVKDKIQESEGIRLGRKRLLYNGIKLEEDRSLSDYNIKKDSTLRLATSSR